MAFIGSLKIGDTLGRVPHELADEDASQHGALEDERLQPRELTGEQRQELDVLLQKALRGTLDTGRELKPWEPQKLNARHVQIIMMRSAGMAPGLIAELAGYDPSRVSVVLQHPYAQYILARVLSYAAEEILDIPARIKAHAGEALDTVVHHMRTGKPELASKNAFGLLQLGGYVAEQRSTVKHEFVVPEKQAALLNEALREARDISELSVAHISEQPNAE